MKIIVAIVATVRNCFYMQTWLTAEMYEGIKLIACCVKSLQEVPAAISSYNIHIHLLHVAYMYVAALI